MKFTISGKQMTVRPSLKELTEKKFAKFDRFFDDDTEAVVVYSCRHDPEVAKLVKGFMIESYIEEGNQKIAADDVFGKSITDPCLGWDASEKLIMELAEIL